MSKPILFDSHCHLNHRDLLSDLDGVLYRARDAGVVEMVIVGYDIPSSREAVRLAHDHQGLWAAVGVHPHDAKTYDDEADREIRRLARDSRVVAIGEIGLDFYRDLSPRPIQRDVFERQLAIAETLEMPVILHHRDATEESYDTLARMTDSLVGCIVHCFNDSPGWARKWLDLEFVLGIGGPLTYPKNEGLRHIIATAPRDKVILETDCPYLTPHPHRGKRNEPAYLALVADEVARLWEITTDEVAQITTGNARIAFGTSDQRPETRD